MAAFDYNSIPLLGDDVEEEDEKEKVGFDYSAVPLLSDDEAAEATPSNPIETAAELTSETTVEQATERDTLARQSGYPVELTEGNEATIKKDIETQSVIKAVQNSKKTKARAGNPDMHPLVKDDVETLSTLESVINGVEGFGNTLANSVDRFAEAVLDTTGQLLKVTPIASDAISDPVIGLFTDEVAPYEISLMYKAGQFLQDIDLTPQDDTTIEDVFKDPLKYTGDFIGEGFVKSIPEMALAMAAPAIHMPMMATRIAEERRINDGRDKANIVDLAVGAATAPVITWLERFGGKAMLGIDDSVKGLKLYNLAWPMIVAAVKEGATEFPQEFLESLSGTIGTEKGFSFEESLKAGIGGVLVGGPTGAGIRAVTGKLQQRQAGMEADAHYEKMNKIMDVTGMSNVRDRSPELFQEIFDDLAAESDVETTDVDVWGINSAMDAAGTPEQAAILFQKMGVTDAQISEAMMTGGKVTLQTSSFIEAIREDENRDIALLHTRKQNGVPTKAEADVDLADLEAEVKKTAEQEAATDENLTEVQNQMDRIKTPIQEKLVRDAGLNESEAEAVAVAATKSIQSEMLSQVAEGKVPDASRHMPNLDFQRTEFKSGDAEFQQNDANIKASQALLAEAAIKRQNREITEDQYLETIAELKPVTPYKQEDLPIPATVDEMSTALKTGQKGRIGKGVEWVGKKVGLRLDIPAYTNHDTWVPTIHDAKGAPVAHEAAAHITGTIAFTNPGDTAETKAGKVGRGETPKAPFAQINGDLQSVDPEAIRTRMDELFNDPEWVQVGYDPRRHTFFYNRETQQPITGATEVLQVGPLVMARNPQYQNSAAFLFQTEMDAIAEMQEKLEAGEFEGPMREAEESRLMGRMDVARKWRNQMLQDQEQFPAGSAAWTDERLDYVIEGTIQLDAQDGFGVLELINSFGEPMHQVAFVDPLDFILATTDTPDAVTRDATPLNVDTLRTVEAPPALVIQDGEIKNHQGRHRMMAMAREGIVSVPILVVRDMRASAPGVEQAYISSETASKQSFPNGREGLADLELINIYRADPANREAIKDAMQQNEAAVLFQEEQTREVEVDPLNEEGEWQSVSVEARNDNGDAIQLPAGEMMDIIDRREAEANRLLECINAG